MHPVRAAALTAALALAAVLGLSAPAQAYGQTPGTYTNYAFPGGTSALTEVTFGSTVQSDPGRGNVFWAHQFGFTSGVGGYIGFQRWRTGTGMFLFSLWDATAAKPGGSGTYCQTFAEGGSGYTCRLNQAFAAGHSYRFRIHPDTTPGWYKATITDATSGTSFVLGSLQTGSGSQVSTGGMVDWVEYFDWNNNAATCSDEPYSKVRYDLPAGIANGASVTASVSSTSVSAECASVSKVTAVSGGSVQEDAIGNSSSGSLTGIGGKCADVSGGGSADGTQIILYGCSGGDNQNWVRAADGTVHALFKCLDASTGSAVQLRTCNGSAAQQWTRSGGTLVNAGRCLDAEGGSSADGTRLIVYACTGGANQQWTVPA